MPNEGLHLGLPEVGGALACEPAAEPLHARDAERPPLDLEHRALALQHPHATRLEDLANDFGLVRLMVVIPEDGDDRNRQPGQFLREDLCLLGLSDPREVAGEQQHVGPLVDVLDVLPERPRGVEPEVQVARRGHADHRTAPASRPLTRFSPRPWARRRNPP